MLFPGELQFVSRRRVGVHERRGPLGASAVARRLAARRGAAFVLPFSFVTFILGKQKKSKRHEKYLLMRLRMLMTVSVSYGHPTHIVILSREPDGIANILVFTPVIPA